MSGGSAPRYGSPAEPTPALRARVASIFGREPAHWHKPHTGLSPALRFVVRFEDGEGVFVKAAVDDDTERWLRTEHEVLTRHAGAPFVSRVLAWDDRGERPALFTEDLSAAHWPADHWPVLWRPGQCEQLLDALERVAATPPPASLPSAAERFTPVWPSIAAEPEPFLALGLCPGAWFRASIDGLVEAEAGLAPEGDELLHGDVRSDNVCFVGDRVVLVDWSNAARGDGRQDRASALGGLPLEDGPDPFDLMPDGGAWAAHLGGVLAWRAAHEVDAPAWLVAVMKRMAVIHLGWASRSLDLLPWTGLDWREIKRPA